MVGTPEIAATASERYLRAWRDYPGEMLRGVAVRLPVKMFWVRFMPVDAWAELYLRTDQGRPWFGREGELLQRVRAGSPLAGLLLAALCLGRAIGLAMGVAAMLAPLLIPRRDSRWVPLLGLWLTCAGLIGVYALVHIEQRYLVPIVPLVCLLGVTAALALRRRQAG